MSKSSELKKQKREVEKLLAKYEKRLKQIESIQNDVNSDFSNNVSDVNKRIDKVIDEENAGTHNNRHFLRVLGDILEGEIESHVGGDANMSEVIDSLSEENSAICRKISELEQEIRDLEQAIEEAEEEEEEERKEKLKNLFGF